MTFPYPPPSLSPNARKHFMAKARAFKAYKQDCCLSIFANTSRRELRGCTKFRVTFCPPDAHRRDIDNAVASGKALFDALSWACGVDDSKFELTFSWGEKTPGGAVIVEAA